MSEIIYVYSAHSAYAYLGSAELMRIAAAHNAKIIHRPILLSPVVEHQGSQPFADRTQAHVDYFFGREIERWAEYRNVPIINHRPTYHDADYSLASGMILTLGESGPAVDDLVHRLLEAHWRDDIDLSDRDALADVATAAGHDARALLIKAGSSAVQSRLKANNDWAVSQSVFGSPTYIVDGDPFYGQDHLGLVERALQTPFAPSTWRNPPVG
ncbi:2-hydroxychromene-2-carboxylate isomerase [Gymnodinialimonas hymeniacidonis]|uniref:2-hydroxychromene-2-carboxylate isomerase n=1 Tax=Gymnodinialimonas hymeniacidonis TaxID=3126508 RepID=UPI0034C5CB8D